MLAICGAGHGGHALAVAAGGDEAGEIGWLVSRPEKARALRTGVFSEAGLAAIGMIQGSTRQIRIVSSEAAEVIPDARLVILVVPAYAQHAVLERIGPYLRDDATLAVVPARGGLEFGLLPPGIASAGHRSVVGLQTLPWLCRVREVGRSVEVMGIKRRVVAASMPSDRAPDLARRMAGLLGIDVVPSPSFLTLTLGNPGQVIHPGCMYALFGADEGRAYRASEIPRLYADMDERGARLIEVMSEEIVTVGRALERSGGGKLDLSTVQPIRQWLETAYEGHIKDTSTLRTCFRTNQAYRDIMAPVLEVAPGLYEPDFSHRFFAEDVPYGLVIVRALADLVAIPTPVIDEVIAWVQRKLRREYLVGGQLRGRDVPALRIPQNVGLTTVERLIGAYA